MKLLSMRYTKHFAHLGVPNLSEKQFKRFMNIVHLEGKIEGLMKAQNHTPELPQKYHMDIFLIGKKLTELTGNLEPNELIKQMYNHK